MLQNPQLKIMKKILIVCSQEQSELLEKTGGVDKVKSSLSKFENMKKIIKQTHDRNAKKINDVENMDQCPSCTQGVPEVVKKELIEKFEAKRDEFAKGLEDISSKIEERTKHLTNSENIRQGQRSFTNRSYKKEVRLSLAKSIRPNLRRKSKRFRISPVKRTRLKTLRF